MSIKKFQFEFFSSNNGEVFVLHNLQPKLKMLVIQNDNFQYNKQNDIYNTAYINGKEIVLVVVEASINLENIQDHTEIKRIIKRTLKWYQSQVNIK